MSQVTEQSVRFQTALASIKLIQASAVLDLTRSEERRVGKVYRERSQSKSFSSCARIGRIFSFSASSPLRFNFYFFKQKTAYEIGLGIPAEPLFRSFNH